eukprot:COSAG02_NODE_106_length_36326_cov_13.777266_35_plen_522_part_00
MHVQLGADEFGSLGIEIDADGTVSAFTHRGSEAETSGLPLGGQIVGVNGERVFGAAAIHAAVESGAPGPFDLEVRVAPITRSAPPPQLPPDDLPAPQLPLGGVPPPPPSTQLPSNAGPAPARAGYASDDAALSGAAFGAGTRQVEAETAWQRVMSGAWWDPAQQRTKPSPKHQSVSHTAPVGATDRRPQRYSSIAPVGTRYSGASSSSSDSDDDGHRAGSRAQRGRLAAGSLSRGPSRLSSRSARDDVDRRSQQRQQRHRPADTVRQTHRAEPSRPAAALQAADSWNHGFNAGTTSGKARSSPKWGLSTAPRDTGNGGDARGKWAVEEQQHRQQQYTYQHEHKQRWWQHEEDGDGADDLVLSPAAPVRAPPAQRLQGNSHGYSKSSLVPDHGSWYSHEDVLPMNRRALAAEQGAAHSATDARGNVDQYTHGGAHAGAQRGARKFTEQDEVSESMAASRQAGPRLSFGDRSRVALGVDPQAAGYGRSAVARGGEDDRAPPPDWSRTHAGRGFPDTLEADEPF